MRIVGPIQFLDNISDLKKKGCLEGLPGTDHGISGPIRGLKKLHPMAQTDRHTDIQTDGHGYSMTNSAQRGRVGENI